VVIVRSAVDEIVRHAKAESPDECCGLLLGNEAKIDTATRARNDSPDPARYRVNPEDHFGAIHAARATGRRVVGVYHSHPRSVASPSPTDLAEASYSEYLYLIVSLSGHDEDAVHTGGLRAYWLRDGRAIVETLRVEP
jgi:proteasome lid subunit RPN8/RPN11|tara:strand:- start:24924 stop:25337 length:414 start_codon:yes stop_codon:yes gene_type:complete